MKNDGSISRRGFLKSSATVTGTSFLKIGAPALATITQAACSAKQENAAFLLLGAAEAADFAAIAARIIPTTDTPGANEAGVIHFFDRALAAEMSSLLGPLRDGLAALNGDIRDTNPGNGRFAELPEEAQDELLSNIEESPFFNSVWRLTMFGFFGMSKHGGNENHISWDLIGFKGNQGAWSFPFGYYDAEYAKARSHGE